MTATEELEPFDVAAADIVFFVGWRSAKSLKIGHVNVGQDAAVALKAMAEDTRRAIIEADALTYSADAHPEPGEFVDAPLTAADPALVPTLRHPEQAELLTPEKVRHRDIVIYGLAVVANNDIHVYLRKANPQRGLKKGKILMSMSDVLTRLTDPVLALDDRFDFVITESRVAVLRMTVFDFVFRNAAAVAQQVPTWISSITNALPLKEGAAEALAAKAASDIRLRRRLQSIHESGHLATVSIDDVRAEIGRRGLDEDELIDNDQLVFDDADPFTLLRLLNEDLFTGGFSGRHFRASGKAPL